MEIISQIGILIGLSIISGILGRMGGAKKFHTLWRDIGCSLIALITLWLLFGFNPRYWWAYLIIFGLHWASFSTYWDWLFGFDNLWFAGFMTGLSCLPTLAIGIIWWLILIRAVLLAVIWGCLNKYLPEKIFIWRRDIIEEFLRYSSVPLTIGVLLL